MCKLVMRMSLNHRLLTRHKIINRNINNQTLKCKRKAISQTASRITTALTLKTTKCLTLMKATVLNHHLRKKFKQINLKQSQKDRQLLSNRIQCEKILAKIQFSLQTNKKNKLLIRMKKIKTLNLFLDVTVLISNLSGKLVDSF